MDLEELTKHQIILLTLLISFVTSIFTGIVTVRLLEQAPPAITQTINRVVERTVERVVPVEVANNGKESTQTVIEKETTVVVKEDDLITESIANNKNKIVRLYDVVNEVPKAENVGTSTPIVENRIFRGIGIVLNNSGLLVTDASLTAKETSFMAETSGGIRFLVQVAQSSEDSAVTLLKPNFEDTATPTSFQAAVLADRSGLKLGQTAIALGGEQRTNVSIGIISDLPETTIESETGVIFNLSSIGTNINVILPLGSPLINIFGEVVGIKTKQDAIGTFTPMSEIRKAMQKEKTEGATATVKKSNTASVNSTVSE